MPGLNLNLNFLGKYQQDENAPTPHNTVSTTTKHINSGMQKLSIQQGAGAAGVHADVGVAHGAVNAQHAVNYGGLQVAQAGAAKGVSPVGVQPMVVGMYDPN